MKRLDLANRDDVGTPEPKHLCKRHPLVKQSAEALRHPHRGVAVLPRLDVRGDRNSLTRALRIMNSLVKSLESRGFSVTVTGEKPSQTVVKVMQEDVAIRLEERYRRVQRLPDEYERRLRLPPSYDLAPTGQSGPDCDVFEGGLFYQAVGVEATRIGPAAEMSSDGRPFGSVSAWVLALRGLGGARRPSPSVAWRRWASRSSDASSCRA